MSPPAKVLLQNIEMLRPGGFYKPGTKAHARAVSDLRTLAAALIALGVR